MSLTGRPSLSPLLRNYPPARRGTFGFPCPSPAHSGSSLPKDGFLSSTGLETPGSGGGRARLSWPSWCPRQHCSAQDQVSPSSLPCNSTPCPYFVRPWQSQPCFTPRSVCVPVGGITGAEFAKCSHTEPGKGPTLDWLPEK